MDVPPPIGIEVDAKRTACSPPYSNFAAHWPSNATTLSNNAFTKGSSTIWGVTISGTIPCVCWFTQLLMEPASPGFKTLNSARPPPPISELQGRRTSVAGPPETESGVRSWSLIGPSVTSRVARTFVQYSCRKTTSALAKNPAAKWSVGPEIVVELLPGVPPDVVRRRERRRAEIFANRWFSSGRPDQRSGASV